MTPTPEIIVRCSCCGGAVFKDSNPCIGCKEQSKLMIIRSVRLNRYTQFQLGKPI